MTCRGFALLAVATVACGRSDAPPKDQAPSPTEPPAPRAHDAAVTAAPAPPIDAAPAPARLDPARPLWGLTLAEVDGWVPEWNEQHRHLGWKHPTTTTPIHVRLLDGPGPRRAEEVAAMLPQLDQLTIQDDQQISHLRSSPHGWSAELEGKSAHVDLNLTIYVALVRHGDQALLCSANTTSLVGRAITRDEAAKVCATLASAGAAARDRDGDAVADGVDACPDAPEPRDGHADDDGCPDSRCEGGPACYDEGAAARGRNDPNAAFAAFRRACEAGHGLGCAAVGDLHVAGEGVALSYERAAALYDRACKLDNPHGCNNLGYALERGRGVDLDADAAERLYERACELLPNSVACENADIMRERRMRRPR